MLFGLAYRLLGSVHDAEDVLQEAYLRWIRVDPATVVDPPRYLTRVVTRLAVDTLRQRQARRETYPGTWLPEPLPTPNPLAPAPLGPDPVDSATNTESLSFALLHLAERLNPLERAVYMLRTAFSWPYQEIAECLDRTPEHCRQLYRRAEQALTQGRDRRYPVSPATQRRLLKSFLAAVRDGDLATLTDILHDDVVAWSDSGGRVRAARNPVQGADKVARFFVGIHRKGGLVQNLALRWLNGAPALVLHTSNGVYVLLLQVAGDQIIDLYLLANPNKLTAVIPPTDQSR